MKSDMVGFIVGYRLGVAIGQAFKERNRQDRIEWQRIRAASAKRTACFQRRHSR